MTLDPRRLHLIADDLESLAANCRALENDAALADALMQETVRDYDKLHISPEELADVGRRMTSGELLAGPNLLLWRNLGRQHCSEPRSWRGNA